MAKEQFKEINFKPATLGLISQCNAILNKYQAQGFDMTLRQLYYQLVAGDIIPNSDKSYKRLGETVSNARLAGLINWAAIVDRTRNLRRLSHWEDPEDIIASAAASFRIDKWQKQPYKVEIWIEKDALAGVFERVCNSLDVPLFSCRGYTSQSEMYFAAKRLGEYEENGQHPLILHFGDHDPSGLDMTRDIRERLEMFNYGGAVEVRRLALNMPQIEEHNPPPNPAKVTDSRFDVYVQSYGFESWELDALDPETLSNLVRDEIDAVLDPDLWKEAEEEETEKIAAIQAVSANFERIKQFLIS